MKIHLGNLSSQDIENRLQITMSDEDKQFLDASRQENVSIPVAVDKWHCFDIPFKIVAGSMDMAIKIRDVLAKYEKDMKGHIQIGISQSA